MSETSLLVQALWRGLRKPVNGFLDILPDEVAPTWVQIMDIGTPAPWRNAVLHSDLPSDEVDATIGRMIEEYMNQTLPLSWYVNPLSTPDAIADRLIAKGFALSEIMQGMIARPSALKLQATEDKRISIELISDSTLQDWVRVHREGWGIESDVSAAIEQDLIDARMNGQDESERFLARYDGEAAGIGTLKKNGSALHLYGTVVLDRFRNRGVYRTLLQARAEYAKSQGYDLLTVHCRPETSSPICRKYGFRHVCDIEVYEFSSPHR